MATTPRKKPALTQHNRVSSRDVKTFFQQPGKEKEKDKEKEREREREDRRRESFIHSAGATIWLSTGRIEYRHCDETNEKKMAYLALLEQLQNSDSGSDSEVN